MWRGPLAYGHATAVRMRELTTGNPNAHAKPRSPGEWDETGPRPADERIWMTEADPARAMTLLADLVRIPSVGGTKGEVRVQYHLAEVLDGLGLSVDLWPLDLPALRRGPH